MKITFLGGGKMTTAIISGLIRNGSDSDEITVIETSPTARALLAKKFPIKIYQYSTSDSLECKILVLAVKPQQIRTVLSSLSSLVTRPLVISIAAGILVNQLSRWMNGYRRIVRAMPNIAASIGRGVTGLYPYPSLCDSDKTLAENMWNIVGRTIWVSQGNLIDGITAVAGSGPAYVFLFLEAMQKAANQLGFSHEIAHAMSIQTVLGAAELAQDSIYPVDILRDHVTAKGGTTEAALQSCGLALKELLISGIHIAAKRSQELSIQLDDIENDKIT